ncbi:MAG: CehA/McbA family metallohydrolase [Actinomycetota bacterium]|nr:CehA/McbA family metallohydrolase [Actinomycetota bacterium]
MKFKKISRSFLVLVLVLTLLGSFSIPVFGNIESTGGDNGGVLFEVVGLEFIREPAAETSLKVVSANVQKDKSKVVLKKVGVFDSEGKKIRETVVGEELKNVSDKIGDTEALRGLLGFRDPEVAEVQRRIYKEQLKDIVAGLHTQKFYLDLKEINPSLKVGDVFTFEVIGDFTVSGKSVQYGKTFSIFYLAALPSITGWHAGDGHIHTNFSDAPLYSVDDRADDASDEGLKWIIMTDHAQWLTATRWDEETAECAAAQVRYSIAVMNGEEISTEINDATGHDSHYLGYNLGTFFWNYNPEYRDGQQIISAVNAHNSPNSFGIIAHPYWTPYPWDYWDARGYAGMELMSGPYSTYSTVLDTTVAKWIGLLNKGNCVVGVANSDSHIPFDAFGKTMTYLYMPNWNGVDHTAVYTALRNGRCVASRDGSLAVFTITTSSNPAPANIGDVKEILPGEPITINIQALGVDGRRISRIVLHSSYAPAATFNASKTTITINPTKPSDYPYPQSDCYFRVKVEFRISGSLVEPVYTNPIWIKPLVTFEDLVEGQFVGTHYPGLIFSPEWRCADHATGWYNTAGYPPHSGTKQVWTGLDSNSGTIIFDEPVKYVEAWFSAAYGVMMEGYDSSGNLVASGSLGQVYGYSAPIRLRSTTPIKT